MKKWLVFVIVLSVFLLQVTPAVAADELTYETFDNWKNPYVAEGWKTHSVGGWGGEFNQIYEAAQEMTCGPGETVYYRSIYRDFAVVPGKEYLVMFHYVSTGEWYAWLQFYDTQNQLLFTAGSHVPQSWGFREGHVPTYWVGHWVPGTVTAPEGASRMRLVFQAGPGDVVAVRNVVLYEAQGKVAGPFINRNTEFSGGINNQFRAHTFGTLSGGYKIRPMGGSSQGISCGGTFNDYKSIYKDFKVTPGVKYKVTVDVVSNSTNEFGTRNPSPVRIWIQYDDAKGNVLSTHGIDGVQAGVKDNEWTTVTIPGPNKEPYTIAPPGTDHARIILQVMGGTGGGTVFDNVSLTRYEQ